MTVWQNIKKNAITLFFVGFVATQVVGGWYIYDGNQTIQKNNTQTCLDRSYARGVIRKVIFAVVKIEGIEDTDNSSEPAINQIIKTVNEQYPEIHCSK